MPEALESDFVVQKRGDRWCLLHAKSGIMHERNFSHKGMAKAYALELTEQGYVPEGAGRVAAMVAGEELPTGPVAGEGDVEEAPINEADVLSVDEDGAKEDWRLGAPPEEVPRDEAPTAGEPADPLADAENPPLASEPSAESIMDGGLHLSGDERPGDTPGTTPAEPPPESEKAPVDKPKEADMAHKGTGTYKSKPGHKKSKRKSAKKRKK